MKTLAGQIALVTGVGRQNGLGAAMCRALAEHGVDIFFTYWSAYDQVMDAYDQKWPSLFAGELEAYGTKARHQATDLSEVAAVSRLWQTVVEQIGSPTILINNACYDEEVPFISVTPEVLDRHYAINVRATALLCQKFVQAKQPGQIINLTSGQSRGSMGDEKLSYTITKAAAEMMVSQLAPTLVPHDIDIYALDPGPVDTGWMTDDIRTALCKASPRGRLTTPSEIGDLVVSILSDEKYPSGSVLFADR